MQPSLDDMCRLAAHSLSRTHGSGGMVRDSEMAFSFMPCRVYPLPLDSVEDIAIGAVAALARIPQMRYWAELFVIPSAFAEFVLINDIFVGVDTQQAARGVQHGSVYSEVSVNNLLNLNCADKGMDVGADLVNNSQVARRLLATFFGVARRDNCGEGSAQGYTYRGNGRDMPR